MASRGRGARVKGASYEREVAQILTEALGIPFQRGLGQTRRGGKEVSDVHSEVLPFLHFECKRQKTCYPKRALEQAIEDSNGQRMPFAITRDDRKEALVTMRLTDFLVLLKLALKHSMEIQSLFKKKAA